MRVTIKFDEVPALDLDVDQMMRATLKTGAVARLCGDRIEVRHPCGGDRTVISCELVVSPERVGELLGFLGFAKAGSVKP